MNVKNYPSQVTLRDSMKDLVIEVRKECVEI